MRYHPLTNMSLYDKKYQEKKRQETMLTLVTGAGKL